MNSRLQIKSLRWKELSTAARAEALARPVSRRDTQFSDQVAAIISKVKTGGDQALLNFTREYDGVSLTSLKVTAQEISEARKNLDPILVKAIEEAIRRISIFHQAQLPKPIDLETSAGVRCERRFFPIPRVGLYVPGGTASLPSTVMMLGVPAKIANCGLRVLITPPRKDSSIDPSILTAASLLGITEIYKAGGAQAIAALAYGTESIPKVDKIYGPGNSWVTEAKLQVSQDPFGAACDLPAGPSEVLVIADSKANASFVASDLLSQAEHGTDSQVVLLCESAEQIQKVLAELEKQTAALPRREIAYAALEKSVLIEVPSLSEAFTISNDYAPEHLILQVENARHYAEGVTNAGSVFIGAWTPESVGDYASGTNHVLPTYGFARAYSGLSTESFMKGITFQELSPAGLKELGPTVQVLAQAEQLEAHRNAVTLRLAALRSGEKS
jgi:histidinol dehydrogenase